MSFSLTLPLLLSGWLSLGRHGRLVCDEQARVLWYNDQLLECLKVTRTFRIDRDSFSIASKKEQSAFISFVQGNEPDIVIWLKDENERPVLALQIQRITMPGMPASFGLRFTNTEDFLSADFRHFETFFNLTKQEALICRRKLEGMTVQDIVEAEGKSFDTVRFHIRNIYRKVGVSSREEFFANLRFFLFN